MALIRRVFRALFLDPVAWFIGACLLLALVAAMVAFWLPGKKPVGVLLIVYQLGGLLTTFIGLIQQRASMNAEPLQAPFTRWVRSFGTQPNIGTLNLTMPAFTLNARGITGSNQTDPVALLQEQVAQLRTAFAGLDANRQELRSETQRALADLSSEMDKAERRLAEKITSGPFVVLFGLVLVALGTILQFFTL